MICFPITAMITTPTSKSFSSCDLPYYPWRRDRYGYNGNSCRNNVFILPSEEVAYFVATVVVIYNEEQHQQRYYKDHTDAIRSIAQHPNCWTFATGQSSGGNADDLNHIRIWDSKSLMTLSVLEFEDVGISVECLAFSQVGALYASYVLNFRLTKLYVLYLSFYLKQHS